MLYANQGQTLSFVKPGWRQEEIEVSNALLEKIESERATVLFLSESDAWPRTYYYRYELWPKVSVLYRAPVEQTDIDLVSAVKQEQNEYVILFGIQEDFALQYEEIFSDRLKTPSVFPDKPVLYEVQMDKDDVFFRIV